MPLNDRPVYPTQADLDNWFVYHSPSPQDQAKYQVLRENARVLAGLILEYCPSSADRTDAIRKLRECVMTANASIACGGE